MVGGPRGTRYSATESGWLTSFTFCDWFKELFLPHAQKLEGKKVLIGDNLSTHLNGEVIQLCRENQIEFVCLPANLTDKLQPLDVGIFGPMKSEWRKLMRAKSDADPSFKSLAKPVFPRLLKELLQNCRPQDHLVAAFENSGLFPISVTQALARIPSALDSATVARHVDAALIKRLEIRRFGTGAKKPRAKKFQPVPFLCSPFLIPIHGPSSFPNNWDYGGLSITIPNKICVDLR